MSEKKKPLKSEIHRGIPHFKIYKMKELTKIINSINECVEWWAENRPRNYRANEKHFKAILLRAPMIAEEVFYKFRDTRKQRVVIALFHNELAKWTRSQIVVTVHKREGGYYTRAMRGYKLDKVYQVEVPSGYEGEGDLESYISAQVEDVEDEG